MGKIMSRLLHAAARGARIDRRYYKFWGLWESSRVVLVTDPDKTDTDYDYRIHPDDEHLQYGPISTALREIALTGDGEDADTPYIRITLLKEDGCTDSTEEQFCVFLLILAEALADSGL
jgi:hypothetical protein